MKKFLILLFAFALGNCASLKDVSIEALEAKQQAGYEIMNPTVLSVKEEPTSTTTVNPTQNTTTEATTTTTTTTTTASTTTSPTTTTSSTTTTPATTTTATTTTLTPDTTTTAQTTTTVETTTTATTTTPSPSTTTAKPQPQPCRRFDGPSFIGGIVLAVGLAGIGYVIWKFYKSRTERNYHTL